MFFLNVGEKAVLCTRREKHRVWERASPARTCPAHLGGRQFCTAVRHKPPYALCKKRIQDAGEKPGTQLEKELTPLQGGKTR